jgi:hypothetical protein
MPRTRSGFEIALGVFAYVIAVAGALVVLWAWGHATVSMLPAAGGAALMIAGTAVLGCRRFIYGATGAALARFWLGVSAIPVLFVATVVLGATNVALNLRWRASESAFQAEVSSLEHGAPVPSSVKIGSYTIDRVDVAGQNYLFGDANGGDSTDCGGGFAFLTGGRLPGTEAGAMFGHLDGNWYTWTCYS